MTDRQFSVLHRNGRRLRKDMIANAEVYDMSDYSSNHPAYSTVTKKVLGKMKDEHNGRIVAEFI